MQIWPTLMITSMLTTICFSTQVLHATMQSPFELWRRGSCGGVQKGGRRNVVVEVVEHLGTVPSPTYSGWLVVTGVHTERRPVPSGGEVTSGHTQTQWGAQVVQASSSHPLPALIGLLTGGWQDKGVIPHPQAPLGALVEESKIIRVQWRCAERVIQWHRSIMLMKTGSCVCS